MPKPRKNASTTPQERKKTARSAVTGRFVRSTSAKSSARSRGSVQRTAASQVRRQRIERDLGTAAESERLERLIDQLGNNRLAGLMGVSRSQPSRWRSGEEGIGPENQRRLIDLDYVFGRLGQLYTPRQAEIWLSSENAHLGARPIDVLRLRGATPVIAAIDAEAQGAFA